MPANRPFKDLRWLAYSFIQVTIQLDDSGTLYRQLISDDKIQLIVALLHQRSYWVRSTGSFTIIPQGA
jgi:hypothetical protein